MNIDEIPSDAYIKIDDLPEEERKPFLAYLVEGLHNSPALKNAGPLAWVWDYRRWKSKLLRESLPEITLQTALETVSPGWKSLVTEAYSHFSEGTRVTGMKQKFGGLKISVDSCVEYRAYLKELYTRSLSVCDVCGQPGSIRHSPLMRTRCDEHGDTGQWMTSF